MANYLYTYGTLRPGTTSPIKVKGTLHDLGWFPGIKLGGTEDVVCEKVEIEDWAGVDRYEGYIPDEPESSLYIRVPYEDGFIYEFNRQPPEGSQIKSGDWLQHKQEKAGRYGGRFK
jgi:gamma-glutamylcyclotransferase (GGCT)/AIG2-like uncharacterized protein YtfP